MLASTTCSVCGYIFRESEPRKPCPNCGGTTRTYHEHLEGKVEFHTGLRARHRRPGFPRFLAEMISRVKRSLNGILAREELTIDRSDPNKTIKTHRVSERQPDGSWKTVHDEKEEFKAKRRPK